MKIKISTFQSRLKHSPDFASETERFIGDIETRLGTKLEYADLSDYDCDVKLLFVQTGGSEGLFLESYGDLKEPFYILTNGANNSLAASMEILTYLNAHGKRGEILHGDADYIAERIRQLSAPAATFTQLKGARLGVIGQPSNWLIASVPDYAEVQKRLGVTLVDIPISELENAAHRQFELKNMKSAELAKAEAIYDALYGIIKKYSLNGCTLRCFDLLTSLKSTGCLALARLNAEGFIATCEGDIATMLSMYVASAVSGRSAFQANPSRIDVKNNGVVFAHCTAPLNMLEEYGYDTHFESGIGVAIKGKLKKQRVTVFRLSQDLKRYFVSGGEICENLNDSHLCRTQIYVRLDAPVSTLLTSPCGNHHVIFYGDYAEKLTRFLNGIVK